MYGLHANFSPLIVSDWFQIPSDLGRSRFTCSLLEIAPVWIMTFNIYVDPIK